MAEQQKIMSMGHTEQHIYYFSNYYRMTGDIQRIALAWNFNNFFSNKYTHISVQFVLYTNSALDKVIFLLKIIPKAAKLRLQETWVSII